MDLNSIKQQVKYFLKEDIGWGDITSEIIFTSQQISSAVLVAKDSFITAGVEKIAPQVFLTSDSEIQYAAVKDGIKVNSGDVILTITGQTKALLAAERVALNLAQRLSGIATLTAEFVKKVSPLPVKILDTRKTAPGLRIFEKYAVRMGGGYNHRYNLADGILVKDNHIAACGSITEAVKLIRSKAPHTLKIEVEATTIAEVHEALVCGVDIIMLDNMNQQMMQTAVKLVKGRVLLEASGGIDLENVREVAETGVDLISIGALTHSAPAVDISMRFRGQKPENRNQKWELF